MTANTEALKPCPFCGATPGTLARPDNIDGSEFYAAVYCHCEGYSATAHVGRRRKTQEEATTAAHAAWNTRAALAQQPSGEPACPHNRNGFCGKDGPCLAPYCAPVKPQPSGEPFTPAELVLMNESKRGALFGQISTHAAQPDGTLHADGYFTWAEGKRPAYLLDKGLPAKFWLAAPAAQPAPAPPGWVLVPVEPTQAMCQEGQWKAQEWPKFPLRIAPIWKAMLAAAPAATGT